MSFDLISPSTIIVDRPSRQRREMQDIEPLARSIMEVGLINPIVIDRQLNLIAGERRLTACISLGMDSIPVHFFDNLDAVTRHRIELEENLKRMDLTWQEEVLAVAEYHRLMGDCNQSWTQEKTAEALGMKDRSLRNRLQLAPHMDKPDISSQQNMSTAVNLLSRQQAREEATTERKVSAGLDELFSDPESPPPAKKVVEEAKELGAEIRQGNFLEWSKTYTGIPYNFIHCDFPYGINVGDKIGQSAAKTEGTYEDTKEVYLELLDAFCLGGQWLDESAHLVFWLSFDFYHLTQQRLEAGGWTINKRPLIWMKSDNVGILPDPSRGPRWIYETAIFATRGDRKITKATANAYHGPSDRGHHATAKPTVMLEHFFKMLVDKHTIMLDPTCGSGNAVAASAKLGATYSLGLELNPMFAKTAQERLANSSLRGGEYM